MSKYEKYIPLKCPDCGNQMKPNGERFDPLEQNEKPIVQCKQCRRWKFE
jgi:hypothetical protein